MIQKLIAFDLDGTLARSKQPIEPEMAALLGKLLGRAKVAITSGGKLEQLVRQVAEHLLPGATLESLYLLPTSGAALFEFRDGAWRPVYQETLSETESAQIEAAMREGGTETGLIDFAAPSDGERIERRGPQVTLSALGQQAPILEKEAWDPGGAKRRALHAAIAAKLPGFDIKTGGTNSIDVTRVGVNKAFGLRKLSAHLGIPIAGMLYVGDALQPGGNDEVVVETGVPVRAVADPDETARVIEALLGE
ncbi:MAG TPA: HAD-IIB family hydrolase [Candidatus Paceibacterota bacterium]